jgi:hypothetical protein
VTALLAALFGLLLQLSLGAQAMQAPQDGAAAGFHTHICGAAPASPGENAPAHHGGMDCLQCPLCAGVAAHAAILAAAPAIVPTRAAQSRPLPGPAETGPPTAPRAAAFAATGPPALI